jgi:DNA-binding SARP family transcriptional activator
MSEPAARVWRWRLSLIGSWQLVDFDVPVEVSDGGRRLLAFLALKGRSDRGFVAGALWPNGEQAQAQANLRATLSRLRRREHLDLVESSGRSLRLGPSVEVDVHQRFRLVSSVLTGAEYSWWEAIRQLTGEELLPGCYEDWVYGPREQLRQLCLYGLESIADRQFAEGQFGVCVQAGLAAASMEPLRESAHRQVIRGHLAAGNRAEAIRHYGDLRRLLLAEVGAEPSEALACLVQGQLPRSSVG